MEKCKFFNYAQDEEEWMSSIGLYDHKRTGYEDPDQYVECPMCSKILHVNYDLIDLNEKTQIHNLVSEHIKIEDYKKYHLCPICHQQIKRSDYINDIFHNEPEVEWLANLVTHYRHDHLVSWNKCWGYRGSSYRSKWFSDYETEKAKINERAKRQIIRKGHNILIKNGLKPGHFSKLQNTSPETMKIAEKKLSSFVTKKT
jgi:rubredoxin